MRFYAHQYIDTRVGSYFANCRQCTGYWLMAIEPRYPGILMPSIYLLAYRELERRQLQLQQPDGLANFEPKESEDAPTRRLAYYLCEWSSVQTSQQHYKNSKIERQDEITDISSPPDPSYGGSNAKCQVSGTYYGEHLRKERAQHYLSHFNRQQGNQQKRA